MGKVIIGSLRLAIGIVCVGLSLILGAQWFGFIPDTDALKADARKSACEIISVNAAAHVRKQQWIDLKRTLQTHADRNPELLSIGIRSKLGVLRIDTGHHESLWINKDLPDSKVSAVHVPITLNQRPWGQVELCFHNAQTSLWARIANHHLTSLLAFFTFFGLIAYTLFIFRVLKLMSSTQVVPDRVRQALDTLAEGLLVLDDQGAIVLANRAFASIADVPSDELTGSLASNLSWVDDDQPDCDYPWMLAINQEELQAERILAYQMPDGSQRIFSVNAAPLGKDRKQRGALATFRDVTHVEEHRAELERMLSLLKSSRDEIKRKNRELEILATQDALTGCLNRRAFFESFESVWHETKAIGTPLSCLMLDIDHFKDVNDTYGHAVGDEVLRQVSSIIRELIRGRGLVCRYGGEEFCVVLPKLDLNQAIAVAEETRNAIMNIRLLDPAELRLTASIGVSEMRFDPANTQDLINQADICLYAAKRDGRNRVSAYNPSRVDIGAVAEDLPQEKIEIPYCVVTALLSALSFRDAGTAEHSRRVANLCARAADGLLDPAQAYITEVAALLHDIGKIGVPDEILHKPGRLTAEEWEVMGRHDRMGKEIISHAFDCEALSRIASSHHAHYGGTGRNRSTPVGDDIPLGARLLAIADSYDAMTSDRVYDPGRSHEEAIAELRRCAGTQFDPNLVEHFARKIGDEPQSTASGALAVQKQAALALGVQVQLLAEAVETQDIQSLHHLSVQLNQLGQEMNVEGIVSASNRIQSSTGNEEIEWIKVLRETYELMDLCRNTQSEFLRSSLQSEGKQFNR